MPSSPDMVEAKNRNFICSCAKAYLSYAALFTHIKQKHGGKVPGEIVRPRSENKRGRPRKKGKIVTEKTTAKNFSQEDRFDSNNSKDGLSEDEMPFQFQYKLSDSQADLGNSSQDRNMPPCDNQKPQRINRDISIDIIALQKQLEEDSMNFQDSRHQLSLPFKKIFSGLQYFNYDDEMDEVPDEEIERYIGFAEIRKFHQQIVNPRALSNTSQDVFILGHIICAFLNFCHDILKSKKGYRQVLLIMVCLVDHLVDKKGKNVLKKCRKGVIQDHLISFCQQYLQSAIIRSRLKFWAFQNKNYCNVLVLLLHWLSFTEVCPSDTFELKNLQSLVEEPTSEIQKESNFKRHFKSEQSLC